MKTLGIDLSMTGTGIAYLEDGKLIYSETIRSKKTGDTPTDETIRLSAIVDKVFEHVSEDFDVVVLEGIAFMAKSTALAQLSGLTYMVRQRLVAMDIPFLVVAPTTLKKFITGKGNSAKDIIMLEIYKRWGISILDNNQADAYALSQIGAAVMTKNYKGETYQKEVVKLISKQI